MSSTPLSTTMTPASITTTAPSIPTSIPSATVGATTSSNSTLSQAQIGGIAGGCVAVAVLAALLALFVLLRRRRGFSHVRDSWSPKQSQGSPGSLSISQPQYKEPKMMSFTRALRRYSRNSSARPGTIGLAISPEGAGGVYGMPGARVTGTGEEMQDVERRSDQYPDRRLVVRNIPPSPSVKGLPSPPPPAVPPMSPRRAVSSFRFFPEDQPLPQDTVPPQTLNSQAKPNLTVAIPPLRPNRQSASSTNRKPFDGGRDSVVTEFAEDGEDSATGLGSALIWRPPATDPASAATYYVADKWGNWVLGGSDLTLAVEEKPIAELATPMSKTAEEREEELRQQSDNRPAVVEDSNAVKATRRKLTPGAVALSNMSRTTGPTAKDRGDQRKSTIRLVTPDSGRLPVNSRSSSVYSSNFSGQPPLQYSVAPTAENPLPNLGTAAGAGTIYTGNKNEAGGKLKGRQMSRDSAATMMSMDSATTIADSPVEATFDDFPLPARTSSLNLQRQSTMQQQGNLSPVVESPGRSPVTYPHIPSSLSSNKRKSLGGNKRPLPNPVLKNLAQGAQLPHFSDSPTLGTMPKATSSHAPQTSYYSSHPHAPMHARKTSPTNPYPDRNPGEIRTGSPNMQDARNTIVVQKRRAATDRARLPSQQQTQSGYGPLSIYDAYNDPSRPGSNQPSMYTPQQQQQQAYEPSSLQMRPDSLFFPQQRQPPTSFLPSPPEGQTVYSSGVPSSSDQGSVNDRQSDISPNYQVHNGSSSSLLAKRLGAERAAGFGQIESPGAGSAQKGWARRRESGGERVLTPKGVVVRGAPGAQGGRGGEGGTGARDTYVQLPATPGWKPQLTPKKKGGDLYLSVK